jgi:putative peptide zinc metalloprotease protein
VKLPSFTFSRRAGGLAVVAVIVLAIGGWAFADGDVPLLSSSTADTSTPASTSSTTAPTTPGASTDNAAVASNTTDGRNVFALALKIVQTDGSTVDATNAAVAAASCTDCQTVAIALEGVLVIGNPDTFDPTNIALAINTDCTNCQTLATAYQQVVQYDSRVRITGAGRQEIADIRQDLQSLRNSGLDILAIQARVNEDAGRFLAVLKNDMVPVGRPTSTTTTSAATPTTAASASSATTVPSTTSTTSAPEPSSSTSMPSPTSTTAVAP